MILAFMCLVLLLINRLQNLGFLRALCNESDLYIFEVSEPDLSLIRFLCSVINMMYYFFVNIMLVT